MKSDTWRNPEQNYGDEITQTTRKSQGQKMAVQILETLQRKEESKPNGWLTPNFRTKIFKVPLRDIGDKHEFKVISKYQGQNGLLGHREHSKYQGQNGLLGHRELPEQGREKGASIPR